MKTRFNKHTCIVSLMLLLAAGCSKATDVPVVGAPLNDLSGMKDQSEARLHTAAHDAIAEGRTREALGLYEKLYQKKGSDPDIVLNYAQLLRKSGQAGKALSVLDDYLDAWRSRQTPVMMNEYAAANIETGHFDEAENILDKVLQNKDAGPYHADADNLLGIALDAQGVHKEAEEAYRQALNDWKGDPTSVMNNLGLCLAAQGKFDDALHILRQALLKAPGKAEIARNIAMVSDLRKSLLPTAPVRVTK